MLTGEGNYKVGLKRSFHSLDSAMQQAVDGANGESSNWLAIHSLHLSRHTFTPAQRVWRNHSCCRPH